MFLAQIIALVLVLGVCLAAFGALGRLTPCNPEHPVFFSRSIGLDFAYAGLGVVYAWVGPAGAALLGAAGLVVAGPLAAVPLLVQLVLLLTLTDLAQYWLHRAFHSQALWPFHAIHHGARQINWTTTFRTHPVNYLVVNTALALIARSAGFAETTLLLAGPIFFFSGALTHANLDWTYGPLRFVIASPVFHRWHHSADPAARETNYAAMFPVWDLMFGTFRMPQGQRPDNFGAEGVPGDLAGQLAYPLRPQRSQPLAARP